MAKITEKSRLKAEDSRCRFHRAFTTKSEQQSEQLIGQIKQLKEIKPRKEWVILAKSEVFAEKPAVITKAPGWMEFISNFKLDPTGSLRNQISNSFSPKRLAYSFATLVFIFVGLIGFAQYTVPGDLLFPIRKISEQSQAALSGQTGLKQDAVALNSRINDLAQAAKQGRKNNIPSAISEINTQALALAKDLKNNPGADSQTLKEIAISLKTLADVPGADLTENQNVKDLYQAIVESQIADLEKTTLTEEQEAILAEIKDLYEQGKYADALEKILLVSK